LRRFGERRDGRGEKRRQCSIARMKRLLAVLAGALGLRALLRRRARAEAARAEATRAEELRDKLAASRDLEADRTAFEGGETPVDRAVPASPVDATPANVESRRADVHARAKQAMDDLKPS